MRWPGKLTALAHVMIYVIRFAHDMLRIRYHQKS
jgi:hypothetical protein